MEFPEDMDDLPVRKIKWMPQSKMNLILLSEYISDAQKESPRLTWIA